jgi:hypothetical protein
MFHERGPREMSWIDQIGRHAPFAARPRLYLHRIAQTDEPSGSRGRRYWVVSRALCRFFTVAALPDTASGRQLDALQLQIERLSPFAETGSHVHFAGEAIDLWLWDARAASEAAAAVGADLRRFTVVPETAMHPPGDGVRLVECLDGVEGQCWEDGRLAASRWWPAHPDDRSWVLLQRGASVGPERMLSEPPPAVSLPWLTRPWTTGAGQGFAGLGNFDVRLGVAAAAIALLVGYAYLGAEWLRLGADIAGVEQEIAATVATLGPITRARAAALANETAIERLELLDRYPSQLAVMALVTDILPKNGAHFTRWSYDRGQLEVTVSAAQPLDATFYVRALDRISRFRAVSAERAGNDNSLRIRLTVVPR